MKIAIIGAGASGLVALKYALDQGHECDVFEKTGTIGGIWVYRDEVVDENGLPICSPMYKDLKTNLPKEVMTFLDFPYPEMKESYIDHPAVLEYFKKYAEHFNLKPHIQFYTNVTQVKPAPNENWSISFQNVNTKKEECKEYNAVFICSGHHTATNTPKIPGQDVFKGTQLHSISFRKADDYKNKRVLIVGGGPSGVDVARIIGEVTQRLYVSHEGRFHSEVPKNAIIKPAVSHFDEKGAVFRCGSREDIDIVVYCTGYNYEYPFLTEECGIQVQDNNWVKPLYKQVINIEHPTMYFIGLPSRACVIPMFDVQVRFALAALNSNFNLPSKEEMMKDMANFVSERTKKGLPGRKWHKFMGCEEQEQYFKTLSSIAGVQPIPEVVNKIYRTISGRRDFGQCFKIVDDYHFIAQTI